MSNNKITFNDLCKSCDIVIPPNIINSLETKYKPIECVKILSTLNLSNNNLRIIDANLIDQYIKSKSKNNLIRFR